MKLWTSAVKLRTSAVKLRTSAGKLRTSAGKLRTSATKIGHLLQRSDICCSAWTSADEGTLADKLVSCLLVWGKVGHLLGDITTYIGCARHLHVL